MKLKDMLSPEEGKSLIEYFSEIRDPRIDRSKLYKLEDILVMAVCALLCGCDNFVEIADFCESRTEWFKALLGLEHGVPSHDTFGDVFAAISPKQFEDCFLQWIREAIGTENGEVIAIDGKTLRRSQDASRGKKAIHLVSAWSGRLGVAFGQVKVDDKSNEITAIPELLKRLALKGCIVSIDAMGTQTDIAKALIDAEADYILALKGNQGTLHEDVREYFAYAQQKGFKNIAHDQASQIEKDHGRIETRTVYAIDHIAWLNERHAWPGLRSIVMIDARREIKGKISTEKRFFISSLPANAEHQGKIIRQHWGIENELHWSLDVTFKEDDSRVRAGYAAENFAILRRIAMAILKQDTTTKKSLRRKRLWALWNPDYLFTLLGFIPKL